MLRLWDPVAYLVRSFQTNARIRSLTTGTFNRVVKDRIALRLSGANSVQAKTHECDSDCPRNLTTIRCGAKPCQRKPFTEFPRDFHNGNLERPGARGAKRSIWGRPPHVSTVASCGRSRLMWGQPPSAVHQAKLGRETPNRSVEERPFKGRVRPPPRRGLSPLRLKCAQRYGLPPREALISAQAFSATRKRKTEN